MRTITASSPTQTGTTIPAISQFAGRVHEQLTPGLILANSRSHLNGSPPGDQSSVAKIRETIGSSTEIRTVMLLSDVAGSVNFKDNHSSGGTVNCCSEP
jgi:hypothetical protein